LLAAGLLAVSLAGCGETAGGGGDSPVVVEETGSIESGDTRDPDYNDLQYDAYTFSAETGDAVVIEVTADGFVPLLQLVEVASGADLAEWEAQYSDDDALRYTIAGPGEYEARVYALEGGSGTYTLTVRVNP
ncbi:MAG TPA: hypothetical protein VFH93_08470, partial [Thermoleophilia bacterium]|nr:hypothetical protein [Thermoleophilia bacterium]